jgi:ArsR family transcriptional regulator, arsenate/arsenite/antimonite-responsive transcriptional repressor
MEIDNRKSLAEHSKPPSVFGFQGTGWLTNTQFLKNVEAHRYSMKTEESAEQIIRYADMFMAMGSEPRLRIMRLLLSAHPDAMAVGDIQAGLGIPNSTLSHHLEKLKNEDLVTVRREGTYLYYKANTTALQELLTFLYAECCTRNRAIRPEVILQMCR